MKRVLLRAVLLFAAANALAAAVPCAASPDVRPGSRLEDLASQYLGDSRYSIAIALATNARTTEGFSYIANPDSLNSITRVCIPTKSEARGLRRSWDTYQNAVDAARLPRIAAISAGLLTIPSDQPVNVVAWVRKDQADRLRTASGEWVAEAPSETWVTVEPHLQEFCQAIGRARHLDEAKLTQRLEQRLGLAPASSKSFFVRMRLDHPEPAVIFRPCVDPATDHIGCPVGPPSSAPPAHQNWLYQQYYSSYGQSELAEFPWTALGYTFDWAPAPGQKGKFQRTGESEFVLRQNAPIQILQVVTTIAYCTPSSR